MKITLCKATKEDKHIIQNLGSFYIYEMSRYCGFLPQWKTPSNGLFKCRDLSAYSEKPDRHAFLIQVDDELAGFALINKIGSTPDVDWNLGEFFVTSKFQGKGVGSFVAKQLFDQFPGIWEIPQMPENKPAVLFWEKVVKDYTNNHFETKEQNLLNPDPQWMRILKFHTPRRIPSDCTAQPFR